jgi:hypothetical protein
VISLRADRSDIAAGARAMVPWLAGIVPFGLVIGVNAAPADVPALAGWLAGPLIYAGSSQLATIGMLDGRSAPVVVVASALIIVAAGPGSYPFRLSMILLTSRITMPPYLERASGLVAPDGIRRAGGRRCHGRLATELNYRRTIYGRTP